MKDHNGKDIFKLGFGLMRLPKLADGSIDIEQTKVMADMFLEAGGTYFDTAYVYDNGGSEEAFRKAVVERYPRESFTLATKLNVRVAKDEASAKQEFFTSLERTGAGYFDYYLLHALMPNNYKLYEEYGIWDFVKEQRDKGLIKHWGFSFHASPEILEEVLQAHPDVDFFQIQLNYADWDNPSVQSGELYRIARKYNKPLVIMEPVKGGGLAAPPASVQKLFKEADPNASCASWALRYVASLDGILTVLSGMSNVEQMKDNLSFMKDFRPLDPAEQEAIRQAQRILGRSSAIPCTGCRYCEKGCPQQIPIPEIFAAMNRRLGSGDLPGARESYFLAAPEGRRATDCIVCRQCEEACPQHLPVTDLLKQAADMFPAEE